jgi:hypothetical protein
MQMWITYVSTELFVPNKSMLFIVLLGKVTVFSLFHIHQQNCVRSVDASMRMTFTPDLDVRCRVYHVSRLYVRLTLTYNSAVPLTVPY